MSKLKLEPYKKEIIEMYTKGISVSNIAQTFDTPVLSVYSILKYYKVFKSNKPICNNKNYFQKIDSLAKAYIVGFIAADGAIVKSNKRDTHVLTITLKYEDKSILEFIKNELQATNPLMEIKRFSSFDKTKPIHHIRFTIGHKQIIEDLFKLGITCNKSLTMPSLIEHIPYEFRKAFVIGYFDGDGSVTLPQTIHSSFCVRDNKINYYPNYKIVVNIRGTELFLKGLLNFLNLKEHKCSIKKYDSIARLLIASKESVMKFYKCYEGLPFFLERKYLRFLERINSHVFDKYR